MKNPSDKTIETYRQNFDKYVERTPAESNGEFREWMDSFALQIPKDGVILEIGSASGRDARYFAAKGFKVVCTDIIPEALQKLFDEGFETAEFDFRSEPKPEWAGKFDGFFANAVLLHAPPDVFENALRNVAVVLKEDGVAAFSLKIGEGEEITFEKMDAPRYFRYHTEPEILEVLGKLPFEIISMSHADQKKWLLVVMKNKKQIMDHKGVIIEESLENKDILKDVKILETKVEEVVEEHKTPWIKQWTLHTVEIPENQIEDVAEKISKALDSEHNWYADFKNDTYHYIIFRDKVFYIDRKSKEQYDEAKRYGISLGIPEYQVDFAPDDKVWER